MKINLTNTAIFKVSGVGIKMKNKLKNITAINIIAFFTLNSLCYSAYSATLLTNTSYSASVGSADRTTGYNNYGQEFIGTNIPASGNSSVNAPYGGSISANYSFTDTSSTTVFDISTAFTAVGWDAVYEGGGNNAGSQPIIFETTLPVNYTISASYSISSNSGQGGAGVVAVLSSNLNFNLNQNFYINTAVNPSLTSASGTLFANTIYYLTIESSAGNGSGGSSSYISGNSDINLTLTAISTPIPSAFWLSISGIATISFFSKRGKKYS